MTVINVEPCTDEAEWMSLYERAAHATVFHRWDFLKVMEKHSMMRILGIDSRAVLYPLVGYRKKEAVGFFPIYVYDSPFVRCAFSPPLASGVTYMGPVLINDGDLKQNKREEISYELQRGFDEYVCEKLKAGLIRVRTHAFSIDARPFIWNGYLAEPMYNYVLDLSGSLESVWEGFEGDLRRNCKKTAERGVKVTEGSEEDIERLFASLSDRYGEQGLASDISCGYLKDVYKALHPHSMRVLVAQEGERYLSGVIMLIDRGTARTWIGMSKTGIQGIYPNDLLLWEAIRWAKENGCSRFEMTWANSYHLCRYKSKSNPGLSIYFSCTKKTPKAQILSQLAKMASYVKGLGRT